MAEKEKENIIGVSAADALIAAHDGNMALYALYTARHPGTDDETAAAVLCLTRAEVAAAREKLARLLRTAGERNARYPEEEPVQYPAREIVASLEQNESFSALVDELSRILGTTPSRAYLNVLVDACDHLGMPPEVVMMLLNYCSAETRRRWGETRRPTAKFISEEAYRWANREILTLELADAYIARCAQRREEKNRVAELLGIRGRELSPTEAKYIESWLEMGFSDEALAAALDRTLTNTGTLKWPDLNGILKNWHAKGLHTAEEIERAEGKRRAAPGRKSRIERVDESELDATLKKLLGDRT